MIDLASGERFAVDGGSDVPTTTGGTWALGDGTAGARDHRPRPRLLPGHGRPGHPVPRRRGWCAPPRNGFNDARITPAGTSLLTFDDPRPSCRTVGEVAGDAAHPFPGVPECIGWDGVLTDDGAVWSVVPNEKRIEAAQFYARVGDGYFDLGPGTSGSLTWCGGSAYFVRDPQRDGDPARLMRWSADGELAVVYETAGGQAFLRPRAAAATRSPSPR